MTAKNILITGINGFIGSTTAKHFFAKGYDIYGIDRSPQREGIRCIQFMQDGISVENLNTFQCKFDYIFHYAGSSTVGFSQQNPKIAYESTVVSSRILLEYMQKYQPQAKMFYASSAAVYGENDCIPIKEDHMLAPISIYGKHKLEVEELCKDFYHKFGICINIIRFFSIYGEGLKKQLLWDFSKKVCSNVHEKSLLCFGTGEEQRDFLHINDAMAILDVLISQDLDFVVVNAGTSVSSTVKEIMHSIADEFNYSGELQFDNIVQKGNPLYLVADNSLIKSFGFAPKILLKKGLKTYVKWYKREN